MGVPYPAAIAIFGGLGGEKLLVADNLSDDVLLIGNDREGQTRVSVSESDAVPGPIRLQWRCQDKAICGAGMQASDGA